MFFKSLCPTVMLASVHSGVIHSSYTDRSALAEDKEGLERDKENPSGPREKNEDAKPVPFPQQPTPSPPRKVPSSRPSTRSQKPASSSPKLEEDKENRPFPAGGRQRAKSSEVRRSREPADNKLRMMPGRCLSPFVMGAHRVFSPPKSEEMARSRSPSRPITPLSNVQNLHPRSPAAAPRGIPTPRCKRNTRRDQRPCQRSPLRISKPSLTLSPNQKLSIVYRHDRFFWDAIEVDDVKGY